MGAVVSGGWCGQSAVVSGGWCGQSAVVGGVWSGQSAGVHAVLGENAVLGVDMSVRACRQGSAGRGGRSY